MSRAQVPASEASYVAGFMRGLFTFIRDVRACDGARHKEDARVAKELAHIRTTFKEGKKTDNYSKKKYVAKLVYIHLLGYDVDFGHMEALALLSDPGYHEKAIGYMALAMLLHEKHDLIPLIVNCAKKDLESETATEPVKCLALSAVAHIGGVEMAENMGSSVLRALTVGKSRASLKQRAALCLLRLHERLPDIVPGDKESIESITKWFRSKFVGVVQSVLGLTTGVLERLQADDKVEEFAEWVPSCMNGACIILGRIFLKQEYSAAYTYHNVVTPWLSIATFRLLRLLPAPAKGSNEMNQIVSVLRKLFTACSDITERKRGAINEMNARAGVLFEAMLLVVDWQIDDNAAVKAASLLSQLTTSKSANLKYLTLDTIARFADARLKASKTLLKHESDVVALLGDDDISIRRRALDCLYSMCNVSNAKRIVGQLLVHLLEADFDLREDLVLKVAILAEKFATVYSWYVDVILQLISMAGDFVSDTIWHRVVQIISNHPDIQSYAAHTCFEALNHPSCHELTVKVGAYVLGEFGHLVADDPEAEMGPSEQFAMLASKFDAVEPDTQAMLLTAFAKMANLYPELQKPVVKLLKRQFGSMDTELQQRAIEYAALVAQGDEELMDTVLDAMPAFPERQFNMLEGVLKKQRKRTGTSSSLKPVADVGEGDRENGTESGGGTGESDEDDEAADEEEEDEEEPGYGDDGDNDDDDEDDEEAAAQQRKREKKERKREKKEGKRKGKSRAGTGAGMGGGGLGLGVDLGAPAAAAAAAAAVVPLEGPVLVAWKRLLPASADGVLFENDTLSVALQQRFAAGRGDVRVAVVNRGSSNLGGIKVRIVGDAIDVASETSDGADGTLAPGARAMFTLLGVTARGPFADSPTLVVSHSAGGHRLVLPLGVHKFCVPLTVAAGPYLTQWKGISGAPQELVRDVKCKRAGDIEFCKAGLRGLNLQVLDAIDPVATNLVAAAAFVPAEGARVPVMIRLQTSGAAKMLRISAKTPSGDLTAGLVDLIEKVLG